jgi:hypothetical protein
MLSLWQRFELSSYMGAVEAKVGIPLPAGLTEPSGEIVGLA